MAKRKGGSARLFRQQQSSINALDAALRQDLQGDTTFTQNQLGAIFGNLQTSARGMKRSLTAAQTRELAAIGKLAAGSARFNRRTIDQQRARLGSTFGGAFGDSIQAALGPGLAAASAAKTVHRAIGSSSIILAAGGQGALAVQTEAAKEARAGADYQLATAYAERSKSDATEVARAQLALDQMRLQAQLDWENRRKEMLLVKRLEEEGAKKGQNVQGMQAVADSMVMASPKLRDLAATGEYDTKAQLYQAYVDKYGAPSDQGETIILQNLAGALLARGLYGSSGTREGEIDAIMDSMLTLYPNFSGHRKQIQSAIDAGLKAYYNTGEVQRVEAAVLGGGSYSTPEGNPRVSVRFATLNGFKRQGNFWVAPNGQRYRQTSAIALEPV